MIDTIETKLLDILEADASLWRGALFPGSASYSAGWSGVRRPDNGVDAQAAGYVNLFDDTFDPAAMNASPGVYIGMKGLESSDREEFPTISGLSASRVEYRAVTIPVIVAVQAATKLSARRQRNQLVSNIHRIFLGHIVETGFWWELTVPGDAGGTLSRKINDLTATGNTDQDQAFARGAVPVHVQYSFGGRSGS